MEIWPANLTQKTFTVRAQATSVFRACSEFLQIVKDTQDTTSVHEMVDNTVSAWLKLCCDIFPMPSDAADATGIANFLTLRLECAKVSYNISPIN